MPANLVDVWEHLLRFQRATVAEMNQNLLERFDHSLAEYDVLHQVQQSDGPIRMGELAERLLVANSSCTRLIGKLVESGHIRRRHGKIDRREVRIELTADGRRLHRRMAAHHTRDIQRLVGGSLEQLRSLVAPSANELDRSVQLS